MDKSDKIFAVILPIGMITAYYVGSFIGQMIKLTESLISVI